MSSGLHATLVGVAAATALVSGGVCLAGNLRSLSARIHAVYGATAAWWLFSMSMVAGAESLERSQFWARLAQLGISLLPGVVYHVNVAVAGLEHEHRRGIRVHYALAAGLTVFCLIVPDLLTSPHAYSWGFYPAYTAWGLIPAGAVLFVFAEVILLYRAAIRRYQPGTAEHARARAFHYGNCFAFLAAVDFLPAFGVPVYPFGFATVALMSAATMFGSARYRLIEVTPEIAAEHILESIPDGLLVVDARGRVRIANSAAARLVRQPIDRLRQQPLASVIPDPGLFAAVTASRADGPSTEEVHFTVADGTARTVLVTGVPVHDPSNRLVAHVRLLHDLTEERAAERERNQLEGRIRQTQKMESLGVMAGGIAHDFNNILMAILGNAEIAQLKVASGEPVADELRTISASAEQAAELTNQLLTYAGRDTAVASAVDLNELCRDMAELLRSAISKKARLDMDLAVTSPLIRGDRSQVRQIILNLVANASDALGPAAGSIILRTAVRPAGDLAPLAPGIGDDPRSGRRVLLEVVDTGGGMDEETQARIFDPFFTTKFTGRGLGLAIVFRIVEGLGGVISVASTPGTGSRFQVVLPELEDGAEPPDAAPASQPAWMGTGVALLADDEPGVRGAVRAMLMTLGFEVVCAADGLEAIERFRARCHEFALVVLDVTMPGLNGREVAAEVRRMSPAVPLVFISGYTSIEGGTEASRGARTAFVHKPFKVAGLAAKVREAIAG